MEAEPTVEVTLEAVGKEDILVELEAVVAVVVLVDTEVAAKAVAARAVVTVAATEQHICSSLICALMNPKSIGSGEQDPPAHRLG